MASALDVFLKTCGVVSHTADVGTDFNTGIEFILRGDIAWGILTLVFIVISMLITAGAWYYDERKKRYLVCFPVVPLGTLIWDLKETWESYRSDVSRNSNNNGSNNISTNDNRSNNRNNEESNTNNGSTNNKNNDISIHINSSSSSTNASNNNCGASDGNGNGNNNRTSNNSDNGNNTNTINNSNGAIINVTDNRASNNNNSNSVDNDDDGLPKHVGAAAFAKLSESITEAAPQSCLGSHVVFQTLYVPGVGGTVEPFQWASLAMSIASLALSIATNDGLGHLFGVPSKLQKAIVFVLLLPVISSRLIICATFGTIVHSAMFLLPIGTEIIVFIITYRIYLRSDAHLALAAVFSMVNVGFGIGCLFISTVPQTVTITALVIAIIAAPVQTWALKRAMD